MKANPVSFPLRGALLARAEAFFRTDLSEVRLSVGDAPARLGAVAVASGETIHLDPSTAALPKPALAELIGHEIAHVVQQREGRAAPRARVGGVAVDDDEGLEAEARDLGRRFAWRPDDRPPPPRERRPGPIVAQRAVSVASTAILQAGGLSERARLALGFVDGGTEWLAWAAADPAVRYDFADEAELVAGVQSGLHASPLSLLPTVGLWVSPLKLMTLKSSDLRALARAERGEGGSVVEHQTGRILTDNDLLSQAELALVAQFLSDARISGAPVVSALGLDAQIAIYDLIDRSSGDIAQQIALQQAAAAFAVQQARTPFELVDFYKSYLVYLAKLSADERSSIQSLVNAAVQVLQPLLFGALEGPEINAPAPPAEISRVVSAWLSAGKQLGFARLSLGVEQILEQTPFKSESGEAAKALVTAYIREAQAFLATNEPANVKLGQDGATCVYAVDGEGGHADLELGPSGILTLRSFRLLPPPTSSSSSSSSSGSSSSSSSSPTFTAEPAGGQPA